MRYYGNPFIDLPNGSVRVNSTFADGTSGVQNLAFGGNPTMNIERDHDDGAVHEHAVVVQREQQAPPQVHDRAAPRSVRAGSHDQRARHVQLQLARRSRRGQPASFTRQLSPRTRSESEYVARHVARRFVPADGRSPDSVRCAARRQPLRERSRRSIRPSSRLFGVRNDNVPNKIYVSPRVGFSWTYGTGPQIAALRGRGSRARAR